MIHDRQLMIGQKLGPYEITAKLGEGGMGEVYRATDTKLKRDVAIKVLPAAFTEDRERLARFEREAQLLAQLHHPNIASIFGLEDSGGAKALVMELVEGPTLAERLEQGSLPLNESLLVARQIAEALEEAHEKGIIHRDLKPQNVKASIEGKVKVLDFGLAKAMDPIGTASGGAASASQLAASPTLTLGATQMGMILGTAAYMAPEQAAGAAADRRADIWAFGVVLYEMLTGKRLFEGETVSHVLASVLKDAPDFTALPEETPERIRNLVRRCLRRKPRERLQSIGDARVILEEVLADPTASEIRPAPSALVTPQAPRRIALWILAAAFASAAATWLAVGRAPTAPRERMLRAALPPPQGVSYGDLFALSPDGSRLAFIAIEDESGLPSLWLRRLDQADAVKLAPSENDGGRPFWSPDGRWLGFFADGKLKRIDPNGGPPQVLCDAPTSRGASWGRDDNIVFSGSFRAGLQIISAAGGAPRELTTLDAGRKEKSHRWPVHLPDGQHLLFLNQTAEGGTKDDTSTIELLDLATGKRRPLVTANSSALFAPQGYLLFWRAGALFAQRFDPKRLEVSGVATAVATPVAYTVNEMAEATISERGDLLFKEGTIERRTSLVLTDRSGRQLSQIVPPSQIEGGGFAYSHDGKRLVVSMIQSGAPRADLWSYDLERKSSTRFTFEEADELTPVWSGDDRRILYVNNRTNDGNLYARNSDGGGGVEAILATDQGVEEPDWSHDGRWLVATIVNNQTGKDIERYDLASKQLTPLVQTPFFESMGRISPDDRWLAFVSEQSGRPEIFLQSTVGESGVWQLSNAGGTHPRWSRDGREIYYVQPPDRMMAVKVEIGAGSKVRSATPQLLFRAPMSSFEVAPGADRLLIELRSSEGSGTALTLITNWPQLVSQP